MSRLADYSKFDNLDDSDEDVAAPAPAPTPPALPAPAAPAAPPPPPLDPQGMPEGAEYRTPQMTNEVPGGNVARTREDAGPDGHVMDAKGGVRSVGSLTPKGSEVGRYQFKHEGNLVYEWDQNLEDVNIYVKPPPGVTPDMIDCKLTPSHLRLGLRGNPPFLDEPTGGPIIAKESHFYMVDGEITVAMSKMRKGETWGTALGGRGQVDPFTRQEIQRELMIERFQEESRRGVLGHLTRPRCCLTAWRVTRDSPFITRRHPGFDFRSAEFNGQVPDPRAFMGGVKYT